MWVYDNNTGELYHTGVQEKSGRRPWGSGERPYQRLERQGIEIDSAFKKAARKAKAAGKRVTASLKKQIKESKEKRETKKNEEAEKNKFKNIKKKKVKDMTNEELKALTDRLILEKNYKDAIKNNKNNNLGRRFISKFAESTVDKLADTVAADLVAQTTKTVLADAINFGLNIAADKMTQKRKASKSKETTDNKTKTSTDSKSQESTDSKSQKSTDSKSQESTDSKPNSPGAYPTLALPPGTTNKSKTKKKSKNKTKTKTSNDSKPKESTDSKPKESTESKPKESTESKPKEEEKKRIEYVFTNNKRK